MILTKIMIKLVIQMKNKNRIYYNNNNNNNYYLNNNNKKKIIKLIKVHHPLIIKLVKIYY